MGIVGTSVWATVQEGFFINELLLHLKQYLLWRSQQNQCDQIIPPINRLIDGSEVKSMPWSLLGKTEKYSAAHSIKCGPMTPQDASLSVASNLDEEKTNVKTNLLMRKNIAMEKGSVC